jgi:hypothetical protein
VWFGGSQLARDLSAPELEQRWAATPTSLPDDRHRTRLQAPRQTAAIDASHAATRAREVLARLGNGTAGHTDADHADVADGIAYAALELMVGMASAVEGYGGGPFTDAATLYELAATTPHRVQPSQWAPVAAELRTAAQRLSRTARLPRTGHAGIAVAALITALAALLAEIAAWREQSGQPRQAAAAHGAAGALNTAVPANDHDRTESKVVPKSEQRHAARQLATRPARPGWPKPAEPRAGRPH